MTPWLLCPPIAFLVLLAFALLKLRGMALLSPPPQIRIGGQRKAYACGETMKENRVQPDYAQFFPFAFFFTIMHVLALVVATVPARDWPAVQIAAAYLIASAVGLFVLFRR